MKEDIYKKIVEELICNLSDRRGIGDEWYQIDDDIQEEIKQEWINIIKKEI